jgi:catechol 2,3-dioxygenase-like lactoylglutathione lyase family enzyme
VDQARHGTLHHVEIWVPNLDRAVVSWGWLLNALGYEPFQDWPGGRSWRCGPTYIVLEQSPARTATRHDRCRPGLNHLAFHVDSRAMTDELSVDAGQHGWRMLFADQYPYAGGTGHYAAYLENIDGFEVELVAPRPAEVAQEDTPVPAPAAVPPPAPAPAPPPVPAPAPPPIPAPAAPPVRPSVFRRSAVPDQQDVSTAVESVNGAPAGAETPVAETPGTEPAVSSVGSVSGVGQAEGSPSAGAPPVPGAPASGSA